MKNTHLHTNVNVPDVDVSSIFQPKGPVKSGAQIFQKPEEAQRDIRAIKNETLIALEGLAESTRRRAC